MVVVLPVAGPGLAPMRAIEIRAGVAAAYAGARLRGAASELEPDASVLIEDQLRDRRGHNPGADRPLNDAELGLFLDGEPADARRDVAGTSRRRELRWRRG